MDRVHGRCWFALITSLSMALGGCVSLERDIYFGDINSKEEKNISATQPGRNFESKVILINHKDRNLEVRVLNSASGSYLWGFLVPVLPVFFLPNFNFRLNKTENLKIECRLDYSYDFHLRNAESNEMLNETKKNGADRCISALVELADGKRISPVKVEYQSDGHSTQLTYRLPIAELNRFSLADFEIQLRTGETYSLKNRLDAILVDWTRYYMVRVAP